ncbi:MAG: MgtC/SapB family protein [Kiloniellales bacterium]
MEALEQQLISYVGTETPRLLSRLGLALLLGLLLGLDREVRRKPAGLRSHMLVSLAAASLTIMTFQIVASASEFDPAVRVDPLRLIEAVVAGVAFLGAGAIIQARDNVVGITTGASLWLAGALGVASGLGAYKVAVVTAVLGFFVLCVLGWIEARIQNGMVARARRDEVDSKKLASPRRDQEHEPAQTRGQQKDHEGR